MIKLTNVSKRFDNFLAVDHLNLEIPEGCIFAFLGVNGAGKTTTIRMMTGVLEPTEGEIEIGGYNIKKDSVKAKSLMGIIPDRPHLYGKLTGREFLQFMADVYKVPNKIASRKIDELLNLYSMDKWQHDLIDSYSHGMKQRLMLCAALVHQPKVLVVDEPMVGLDPLGAKLLKDTFREHASRGMTIFMSTHSLSVAEEIADLLAIIQNGKVMTVGTLSEIFSRARNGASGLENAFLEIIASIDDSELKNL